MIIIHHLLRHGESLPMTNLLSLLLFILPPLRGEYLPTKSQLFMIILHPPLLRGELLPMTNLFSLLFVSSSSSSRRISSYEK